MNPSVCCCCCYWILTQNWVMTLIEVWLRVIACHVRPSKGRKKRTRNRSKWAQLMGNIIKVMIVFPIYSMPDEKLYRLNLVKHVLVTRDTHYHHHFFCFCFVCWEERGTPIRLEKNYYILEWEKACRYKKLIAGYILSVSLFLPLSC